MRTQRLAVPPRTFQWGRNIAAYVLAILLGAAATAQDIPPLPGDGGGTRLTPEEQARLRAEAERRAKERAAKEAWLAEITIQPIGAFSTNRDDRPRLLSVEQLLDERRDELRKLSEQHRTRSAESMERLKQHLRSIDRMDMLSRPVEGGPVPVGFEDGAIRWLSPANYVAAKSIQAHQLWPGEELGLTLTGNDGRTNLAMWDAGIPGSHEAFAPGKITDKQYGQSPYFVVRHPTRVAGTLTANSGITAARGVAYESKIDAYDFIGDFGEMGTAYDLDGIRISNHSYLSPAGWQTNANEGIWYWFGRTDISEVEDFQFGSYHSDRTRPIDVIAAAAPKTLIVWAASNDRGYPQKGPSNTPPTHKIISSTGVIVTVTNISRPFDGDTNGFDTLPPEAVAKNVLTVGSVGDLEFGYSGPTSVLLSEFSSMGPTDSGRIKPDLVANGDSILSPSFPIGATNNNVYDVESGTSYAAPSVAGAANLLLQLHRQLHPGKPDPLSSTWKALLINTTDEAGPAPGPDFQFGWGLVNIGRAARLMQSNALSAARPHLPELMLQNGGKIRFPIMVATTNQEVRATICWSDPAGPTFPVNAAALDNPATDLVNNLDLRIISPTGVTNFAWVLNADTIGESVALRSAPATKGTNNVDNVEQVQFWPVETGLYAIEIGHQGTLAGGFQLVSLAVSGNQTLAIPPIQFVDAYLYSTNAPYPTFVFQGMPGLTYRIEYLTNVTDSVWHYEGTYVMTQSTNAFSVAGYDEHRFYRAVLQY